MELESDSGDQYISGTAMAVDSVVAGILLSLSLLHKNVNITVFAVAAMTLPLNTVSIF